MNAAFITKKSRTNFAWAFFGLSKAQRSALQALYAFCRTVDDIVDCATDLRKAQNDLHHWREILERLDNPSMFDPVIAKELSIACKRFAIERTDLHWIVDGVEDDLHRKRYRTFEELLAYCDGVASAVGLASMAIFGANRQSTLRYAVSTGRALQLTNILRDVAVDAAMGRIYLPLNDLTRFGYREKELLRSAYNERFQALMAFQVERIKTFYRAAEEALPHGERKKYPAAEVMRKTYRTLLGRIEAKHFNIFPRKVRVSSPRKIAIAASVWVPHILRTS